MPSLLDPSAAPAGRHAIHAYLPATEPYDLWEGVRRGSPEYKALKRERAEPLYKAIERFVPDIRDRIEVC
jgi:phytoene dehydrogenase-like protein